MSIEDIIQNKVQEAIQPLANAIELLASKIKSDTSNDEIAYPVAMVAVLINRSKATIYNMIDRGELKTCNKKGESDKIKYKDFKHLINS
ncbi:helix-turn-helix domain-containing protein [Francisella marina]|uniref:Helix-turn-helix domain-containing protein n=1 Tax=Francisella marina TaxID=2249302 RepID=A0ABX5ZHG0_9GAMM|nr:helix-turn-helix domain-containing protein [Francisella marina]QEO57602.1 helix-turn-helix domain-containing protein [Francisella marina]QEO58283.1 helix-turn-helix domain-containing protein [Francisella marina]